MARRVRFHFDFISPYSYLALTQAEAFAAEHGVRWEMRPILYAALLDATGLIGPAETPVKREYSIRDIVRSADRLGVPLVGPPVHPFNPLCALRAACLFQDDPRGLALATRLSTMCWGEGLAITEPEAVVRAVAEAGLEADGLAERLGSPEAKALLRDNTDQALSAGVFGVPTFIWRGELFWGHDRMDHLAERLAGRLSSAEERGATIAARPRGAQRPVRES
ncbi:2-hydroxychromene-2-carboxylate isomerase [soil metagenome]